MRTAAYITLLATARAATLGVTNDAGSEEWSTASSYSAMSASVGDVISFSYSAYHDVWKMADATAYAACSATGGTELGTNSVGGGSGSLTNVYEYTVTSDDLTAGTIYFGCSYYPLGSWSHCVDGQAISVTISPSPTASPTVSSAPTGLPAPSPTAAPGPTAAPTSLSLPAPAPTAIEMSSSARTATGGVVVAAVLAAAVLLS